MSDDTQRGSGRTTRMLIEVLDRVAAGEKGTLLVIADSHRVARMCLDMFMDLAVARNYSPERLAATSAVKFADVRVVFHGSDFDLRGWRSENVYFDHFRSERTTAPAQSPRSPTARDPVWLIPSPRPA